MRVRIHIATSEVFILLFSCIILSGCHHSRKMAGISGNRDIRSGIRIKSKVAPYTIKTGNIKPEELVSFAETLQGVRYQYGGTSPETGFDCSGFIGYVFGHFNIKVPRVSEGFTNAGKETNIVSSKPGDLILFTGSDPRSGKVGHIGLITENKNDRITFIHSASGGNRGVMKSQMTSYFTERFVKVNRVFEAD